MGELLGRDDLEGARRLLPSLCGRDPALLDAAGLIRATVESVAENTSDAQVAPLLWACVGGVPGVLGYRAINTLDAMVGHRSPRYARFGWAAARLDDVANYVAARVTAALTVVCAPIVGGSPWRAVQAWRRDARRHPSPNAGVVEAAFAGALGVRLGGADPVPLRIADPTGPRRRTAADGDRSATRRAAFTRRAGGRGGAVTPASAPPSVAVGELVFDGRRLSAGSRAGRLTPARRGGPAPRHTRSSPAGSARRRRT